MAGFPSSATRSTACPAEEEERVAQPAAKSFAMPSNVWRILANEFGERFSYYGLRAVLTLYFVSIGNTEAGAVSMFAYTSALAYFMPLLGGVVADVFWGRYRTILVFSLIYVLGSFGLALNAALVGGNKGALFSLLLISLGTGGIKPCVSAFGADQLGEGDEFNRARYFSFFYLSINAGSTLSFIVTPLLRVTFGFASAFGAATVILGMAVVIFVSGQSSYHYQPPAGSLYIAMGSEMWQRFIGVVSGKGYQQLELKRVPPEVVGDGVGIELKDIAPGLEDGKIDANSESSAAKEALAAFQRLLPVLLLMPCFWALFDQQGSAWVLQAKSMRLDGVLPFGWRISPEMLQIFNPIFVLTLLPLTTRLFEAWPSICRGRRPPPALLKMTAGMGIASSAFVCSAFVQRQVDRSPEASVSVLWQLPQLFLITLAEVLVSVVSLEYFYAEAPAGAKTAASALQLLTVALGDLLCGFLYQVLAPKLHTGDMLLAFAGLMFANACALLWVARRGSLIERGSFVPP